MSYFERELVAAYQRCLALEVILDLLDEEIVWVQGRNERVAKKCGSERDGLGRKEGTGDYGSYRSFFVRGEMCVEHTQK